MWISVPQERLTRHEISWLLAQEARGAAKALRTEVDQLRSPERVASIPPVETTLDALDDAIEMLSELNTGNKGRSRRGRIDLAALLYEIVPNARIAIEPGAGTEVFGDEVELRRMLHLLVGQASGGPSSAGLSETEVQIRRKADFVRIAVNLGPDTAQLAELEHRWLSRMALRHGGSVELEGGTLSVLLQADGASDKREVTELRKELAEAQELGEAYARELASMLSAGDVRTEAPPAPAGSGADRFEAIQSGCAATERVLRGFVDGLRSELQGLDEARSTALGRRLGQLQEFRAELLGVTACSASEAPRSVDASVFLAQAAQKTEARAARGAVELSVAPGSATNVRVRPGLLELLMRSMLDHAVQASPKGGRVKAQLVPTGLGIALTVSDEGPKVPEGSRLDVLRHRIDPTSLGRPAGLSLLVADAAAAALDAELELRESASGGSELWVTLKKG
jgi:two-component system OmpR family sensor kinase